MRLHDAALLARMHAASFADAEAWGPASMAAALDMPGAFACISPCGDGMALVRLAADEAELLTFAVVPNARRRGIGRALLERAVRECRDAGAVRLYLEVSTGNAAARALYAEFGFIEVGRRRRYYPDGSDALIMVVKLEIGRLAPCGSGGV